MKIDPQTIDYFVQGRKRWDDAYFDNGSGVNTPIYAQLHEFAMAHSSLSGEEFYKNGSALVKWEAKTAKELGLHIPDITFDCYNIEVEALGGEVEFYQDKAPELVETPLTDKGELLHLDSPDPYRDGRMPFVLEVVQKHEELFGSFPRLNVTAPFTLAAKLRGVQEFLLDIIMDRSPKEEYQEND